MVDSSVSTDEDDSSSSFTEPSLIMDTKKMVKVTTAESQHEPRRRDVPLLGWYQTFALMRKNFLTKFRTPIPTFFELFSPVLMMLILVAAYTLSDVVYKDAKTYSSIQVDVPGPWLGLLERSTEFFGVSSVLSNRRLVDEHIMPSGPDYDPIRIYNLMNHGFTSNDGEEEELVENVRKLQEFTDDDVVPDNSTSSSNSDSVFDLLNDARGQLSRILKSPIGVPSFAQYVYLSKGLSSIIDADDLPRVLSDSSFGRQWGNLLTLGTLHLSPNNTSANDFLNYLQQTYPLVSSLVKIRIHDSETKALDYINDHLEERTWALLDFEDMLEEDDQKYKIRMNYTTLPNTNQITNVASIGLNTAYQRYYLSGYLTLQSTLNTFVFSKMENATSNDNNSQCSGDGAGVWSMPMPTAAYSQNQFFQAVGYLLGLTIAMAYMYPVSRAIKSLVEEKETRMKETLFILGVRTWAHWLSWVLTLAIIFLIITLLVTITLSSNVLKHSSPAYLLTFIGLFSASTIGFSFFVASFFSRAKLAAIVGPVALFATLLPRFIFFGTNRYEATTGKMIASLLPCTAFAFGADIIADYEYAEQGVQSWNADEGEYSFNTALGFLFVDTLLYMFLGWYFELIIPRQYGVARKWYFIFTPKYWRSFVEKCCSTLSWRKPGQETDDSSVERMSSQAESDSDEFSTTDFEQVSDLSAVPRVRINNLVKRYNSKQDVPPAVDKLKLDMYESQITCLLGHNGAGKTTTISVLTGLFPPTSGDCTIYGHSIVDDLIKARESMGICPQHNVLFDSLTVTEHLALFERLKGMRPNKAGIKNRAQEIGLQEFRHTTASALSGGNKRKLSVAISLCGDPKFLLLDEPTSGMDPASRRACWELLRDKRRGRVTLLTTHFMDEAELLADRIAIMKQGKLQCCGTSLFLKNRFGLGYNLTLVLEHGESSFGRNSGTDEESANPSTCVDTAQVENISAFLKKKIPKTELVRRSARELTFRFPHGSEELFPELFDCLEENRGALGIGNFGVSNTTLEEVFLRLAEENQEFPVPAGAPHGSLGNDSADSPRESQSEFADPTGIVETPAATSGYAPDNSSGELQPMGALRQVALLYKKRLIIQKRDFKGFFFMVLLPVILIALVLLVLTIDVILAGPAIEMSVDLYRKSPSGTQTRTDVLVAGGASSGSDDPVDEIKRMYKDLNSMLGPEYDHADFIEDSSLSSQQISQMLLDSYNDRSHNARYGAFVMEDAINVTVSIDWKSIENDVKALIDSPLANFGSLDTIDVLSLLGVSEDGVSLSFTVAASDLADAIVDSTPLTLESSINLTSLSNVTSTVLDKLMASSSDPTEAQAWFDNVTEAVFDVVDTYRDVANTTDLNMTELLDAAADFVSKLVDIITDGVESGLDDTNLTAVVEGIFNGDDINVTHLMELGIQFIENVTEVVIDGANTTFNGTRVVDMLEDLSENATSLVDSILTVEEYFTRNSVVNSYATIMNEVLNMLDVDSSVDFDSVLTDVFAVFDDAVAAYGNYSSFPNTLLTIPIVAADGLLVRLVEWGIDGEYSLGNALGELSDVLGGEDGSLDGYVKVSIAAAAIDVSDMSVTVTDAVIETSSGTLFSVNGTFSLGNINLDLWSLLPRVSSDYRFEVGTRASILHNATSPHAVAAFNQAYSQYLYKKCSSNMNARLTSVNHPLPLTAQQSIEIQTMLSILASLFLLIPLCYILGAFIVFPVKERVSKCKHLQLVSGVNMTSYWAATYLWDLTLFLVLTLLTMVVFLIYGNQSAQVFVGTAESFFATMLLIFGYGMSALPFSYLLSRLFDNHSSAQIAVMGIFFITGFVAVNAYYIMVSIDTTKDIAEALRPLFRCWPAYNVGEGLILLSASYFQREVLGEEVNPFDWDVAGKSIALCYLLMIPYGVWLMLLEYAADGGAGGMLGRLLRRLSSGYEGLVLKWCGVSRNSDGSLSLDDGLDEEGSNGSEDEDVVEERTFVIENKERLKHDASVLLTNLWKVYPPSVGVLGSIVGAVYRFVVYVCTCGCVRKNQASRDDDGNPNMPKRAVRGLHTAIHEGETFGLLGQNGGGKSTTLGMLTGDIRSTAGEAFVAGHDVTGVVPGGVESARKNIGFCPQVDPLLDLMTGRETLTMFGRLRGIPEERLTSTVSKLLDRLTLTPHADKTSVRYSGGNKRKLSLGIALIGDPRVLFIDEASSGMDPGARRHMWSLIEEVSQHRSVILTTHSMEEAEALCTRVGIMVHGKLLCLGSVQHLKSTYLDGYTVDIHCARGTPEHVVDNVENEILHNALPGSRLTERHGSMMRFDVSSLSAVGLGTTFRRLESVKQNLDFCVEDYSIAQCSLEQVFISLVGAEAQTTAMEAPTDFGSSP